MYLIINVGKLITKFLYENTKSKSIKKSSLLESIKESKNFLRKTKNSTKFY